MHNPTSIFAAIAAIGGFIFGFDAAVISGVIGPVTQEWLLDSWTQGLVVGAPTLGGIIATLVVGPLSDAIGRRTVLFILAGLYIVSAAMSALAPSVEWLVVARFIGGPAYGSLMLVPIYIAEIAAEEKRGRLVSFNQFNIVVGLSAAYFSNYFLLQFLGEIGSWRWMLGIELVPAAAWLGLLTLIPESPRWYAVRGWEDRARAAWQRLNTEPIDIALETTNMPWSERLSLLFSSRLRLAIIIGLVVGIAQQVTGVNAIYFYAPTIFEQSGVGTDAAFAQATLVGVTNVIFTIIAMALIDRLGRKPLLFIGLGGIAVSTALTAACFAMATYQIDPGTLSGLDATIASQLTSLEGRTFDSDTAFKQAVIARIGQEAWLAHQAHILNAATSINAALVLVGILGFVASFAVSLGPVMWVLFSEIFPNHIRGLAVGFVGLFNSLSSFGVQFVFPWELETLGAVTTFGIYAGLAVVALVIIARILPETKQRSLEELEQLLTRSAARES